LESPPNRVGTQIVRVEDWASPEDGNGEVVEWGSEEDEDERCNPEAMITFPAEKHKRKDGYKELLVEDASE
jgi:hypothetical protein